MALVAVVDVIVVEEVVVVLLLCELGPAVDAVVGASVIVELLALAIVPTVGVPFDAVVCELLDAASGVLVAVVPIALAVEAIEIVDAGEIIEDTGVTVAPDVDAELVCVNEASNLIMYIHFDGVQNTPK